MTSAAAPRRAVLVTGASSGIGRATVENLARDGIVVFAGVRTQADADEIAALHANIVPLLLDVTDREAIANAVRTVTATGHQIFGVVNNAGIALGGALEYLPLDELRRQFEVNVFGPVAVSQAFLPLLRAQRGRLVFVGSVSGQVAVPFIAPYSSSKFALRALSDGLRLELEPTGVRVSLVAPGSARTPIWEKGRAAGETMLAQLGADAPPHYRKSLENVVAQTEREERSGLSVARIVMAIRHALLDRRPRAHYYVGASAQGARVLAVLPSFLRDQVMRGSVRR